MLIGNPGLLFGFAFFFFCLGAKCFGFALLLCGTLAFGLEFELCFFNGRFFLLSPFGFFFRLGFALRLRLAFLLERFQPLSFFFLLGLEQCNTLCFLFGAKFLVLQLLLELRELFLFALALLGDFRHLLLELTNAFFLGFTFLAFTFLEFFDFRLDGVAVNDDGIEGVRLGVDGFGVRLPVERKH